MNWKPFVLVQVLFVLAEFSMLFCINFRLYSCLFFSFLDWYAFRSIFLAVNVLTLDIPSIYCVGVRHASSVITRLLTDASWFRLKIDTFTELVKELKVKFSFTTLWKMGTLRVGFSLFPSPSTPSQQPVTSLLQVHYAYSCIYLEQVFKSRESIFNFFSMTWVGIFLQIGYDDQQTCEYTLSSGSFNRHCFFLDIVHSQYGFTDKVWAPSTPYVSIQLIFANQVCVRLHRSFQYVLSFLVCISEFELILRRSISHFKTRLYISRFTSALDVVSRL